MAWFTYKGDGTEFHEGIPARDMDQEDWERLSLDQQTLVLDGPLYDASNYKRYLTRMETAAHKAAEPAAAATGGEVD